MEWKDRLLFAYDLQWFAKDGPGGEKTEPATEKKLREAREDGSEYADRHREALNAVKTIPELQALLDGDRGLVEDFIRYAARQGVAPNYRDIARSRKLIEAQLRAYIGRNTALEDNGFYANIYPVDNVIVRAVGILNETREND